MMDINIFASNITFKSRPESIPGDLRPVWKICVIILMLELASRGQKASLSKLHILNWALQSKENQTNLLNVILGKETPDTIIVRIEPSLNRALNFAKSEGLVDFIAGKNVQLTGQGLRIASLLLERDDTFIDEKTFLREIGKQNITDQFVTRLFSEGL